VFKPFTVCNDIISSIGRFPALCAAADVPNIKEKVRDGLSSPPDGFDAMPYFLGRERAPVRWFYYFEQSGRLNASRVKGCKVSFAMTGNRATVLRKIPARAQVTSPCMDSYERGTGECGERVSEVSCSAAAVVAHDGADEEHGMLRYALLRQEDVMMRLKGLESFTAACDGGR
jgi:hypothetical protein